ncbi:MAG: YgiT-type zinc finger protein [Planctomycetia bacterium]|nr:YgiT-type zinc finger protein [Planctomycetia bacterium]
MPMPYETFEERLITYTQRIGDRFILIENVPCRVCVQTGEQLFSPETAEWIRQTVWSEQTPVRVIETEVFDFANRNNAADQESQNKIRLGA